MYVPTEKASQVSKALPLPAHCTPDTTPKMPQEVEANVEPPAPVNQQ